MEQEDVRRILEQVTQEILEILRRDGFYYQGQLRYDPLVWDINNGHCSEWAERAAEFLPGGFTAWVDEFHCALAYEGRFYDAESPAGVDRWQDLPILAHPQQQRPEP